MQETSSGASASARLHGRPLSLPPCLLSFFLLPLSPSCLPILKSSFIFLPLCVLRSLFFFSLKSTNILIPTLCWASIEGQSPGGALSSSPLISSPLFPFCSLFFLGLPFLCLLFLSVLPVLSLLVFLCLYVSLRTFCCVSGSPFLLPLLPVSVSLFPSVSISLSLSRSLHPAPTGAPPRQFPLAGTQLTGCSRCRLP